MSSKRKSHPMKLADEMSIPSITAMPMYPGSSVFPPLLLPPLYRPEFRYGPLVQDGLTGTTASDSIVEDNETVRDNADEIEDAREFLRSLLEAWRDSLDDANVIEDALAHGLEI